MVSASKRITQVAATNQRPAAHIFFCVTLLAEAGVKKCRGKWSGLEAIDDWKAEFAKHPKWQGKSPKEMHNDHASDAAGFYASFCNWVRQQPEMEQKALRRTLFKTKRSHLKEIDDWKAEFAKHPEWQGKSFSEMKYGGMPGARAFCDAFYKWVGQQPEKEQEVLRRAIFKGKWSHLKTIDDWKAEFAKHPVWRSKSSTEMRHNKFFKARSFYHAFYGWVRQHPQEEWKALRKALFTHKSKWSHLKAMEDWKAEFAKHPAWQGKSPVEMRHGKSSKAQSFCDAFYRWVRRHPKEERKALRKALFAHETKWSHLKTMDGWKAEFAKHPKWQGRLLDDLMNDAKSRFPEFYADFLDWRKGQPKEQRGTLSEAFFPRKSKWHYPKTIEGWKTEFAKHPEWQGRSTTEMQQDKASGASTFYMAFYEWVGRQPEEEQKALKTALFTHKSKWSHLKTIDDWKAEFAKHPKWQGKSSTARAFYGSFHGWVLRQPIKEQKELRHALFGDKWIHLKTIGDWEAEFAKHPEWRGKSGLEMLADSASGACTFYVEYCNWRRKEGSLVTWRQLASL